MSPREAVARAQTALAHPARPVTGSSGSPGATARGPRLTVVPRGAVRPPRAPFVLLVGALLVVGLAGLLMLNTTLAQGSFRVQDLQQRAAALQDEEQGLGQAVAGEATPQRLAARATALGMVPSVNPVFIRTADGTVLGRPQPGAAKPTLRHAPAPTRPAPATKPTTKATKTVTKAHP